MSAVSAAVRTGRLTQSTAPLFKLVPIESPMRKTDGSCQLIGGRPMIIQQLIQLQVGWKTGRPAVWLETCPEKVELFFFFFQIWRQNANALRLIFSKLFIYLTYIISVYVYNHWFLKNINWLISFLFISILLHIYFIFSYSFDYLSSYWK